jgi:starch phosphorylase
MRESMAQLTPRFSTNRAVCEYTEQHYLPRATAYRARAADSGALGESIVGWSRGLKERWSALHFGEVKVRTAAGHHVIEVEVLIDALDPKAVRVELYADGVNGGSPTRQEMTRLQPPDAGGPRATVYRASVPATRPATDYTPRVVPYFPGVSVPLELPAILWQR